MKKGREADARKAITKLFGPSADVEARIDIIRTELKQAEAEEGGTSQTSWLAIFSKEHRSRTFTSVLSLQSQNFSGGYFANTYQVRVFGSMVVHCAGSVDLCGLTDKICRPITLNSSGLQTLLV
jgi:MFS transporter, SP family, general alpha glucoside:H+ symporter